MSPGLQQRVVDGDVRLRAGVRLDVGVLGAEQRLGAVDRELLGHVDELAAAVVAPAGIALGVLVGQHRALRLEHRHRHEVLGGDHLERALLAIELHDEDLGDLGIDLGERCVEVVGGKLGHRVSQPTSARWRLAEGTSATSTARSLSDSMRPTRSNPASRSQRSWSATVLGLS